MSNVIKDKVARQTWTCPKTVTLVSCFNLFTTTWNHVMLTHVQLYKDDSVNMSEDLLNSISSDGIAIPVNCPFRHNDDVQSLLNVAQLA